MSEVKNEKIKEAVRHAAAEFFAHESNRTSLITVTAVELSEKGDRANILFTVYPETAEKPALEFARRNVLELRALLAKRLSIHHLPFLTFAIDIGEKNRQKLDRLSDS